MGELITLSDQISMTLVNWSLFGIKDALYKECTLNNCPQKAITLYVGVIPGQHHFSTYDSNEFSFTIAGKKLLKEEFMKSHEENIKKTLFLNLTMLQSRSSKYKYTSI